MTISRYSGVIPEPKANRYLSPSTRNTSPTSAPQSFRADSTTVSSTASRSDTDRPMTARTSLVAVSCSRASASSSPSRSISAAIPALMAGSWSAGPRSSRSTIRSPRVRAVPNGIYLRTVSSHGNRRTTWPRPSNGPCGSPLGLLIRSSEAGGLPVIATNRNLSHAGVPGLDDGLGPVGDLQLGQDVGHVVADGLVTERQTGCDRGVGAALGEQIEHLAFPAGQLREGR